MDNNIYPKNEALEFLFSRKSLGMKLGLDNIKNFLNEIGNPHLKYKTIHIAGTNGKGSVSSIISKCLEYSGFKVGLNTSPHLIEFNERFRINGKSITDKEINNFINKYKEIIIKHNCTFFEISTALAAVFFLENNVDYGIFEVGMGGRLDATNLIIPEVSIITNIGFDHVSSLGDTYEKIAAEKGGIIKENIPIIVGKMHDKALGTIEQIAKEKKAPLYKAYDIVFIEKINEDFNYQYLNIKINEKSFKNIKFHLLGNHQLENLQTSLAALYILLPEKFVNFIDSLKNVYWPGRFDYKIIDNYNILIDAAHNFEGMQSFIDTYKNLFHKKFEKVILLIGILRDKKYEEMIKLILPFVDKIIVTRPESDRALEATELLNIIKQNDFNNALAENDIKNALNLCLKELKENDLLLSLGSIYLIGEVMRYLNINLEKI